ncbi:MAG: class I SAM-dependent methyltransferase [Candidatus Nanoarchaeia archaeon]
MDYYDEIAQGYDSLHKEEQLKKLEIIKEHINITKDTLLLDVGCGSGISTEFWDCDATGIDPSHGLIEFNKEKKTKKYLGGKAESLPFLEKSFDVVISITAIHNFDNFRKGIDEMKRVGKEVFVFSVLKKADHFAQIEESILKSFSVKEKIVEEKDVIFLIY